MIDSPYRALGLAVFEDKKLLPRISSIGQEAAAMLPGSRSPRVGPVVAFARHLARVEAELPTLAKVIYIDIFFTSQQ